MPALAQTRFRGWPRHLKGPGLPRLTSKTASPWGRESGVGATDRGVGFRPYHEREERVVDALAAEGSPHLTDQRTELLLTCVMLAPSTWTATRHRVCPNLEGWLRTLVTRLSTWYLQPRDSPRFAPLRNATPDGTAAPASTNGASLRWVILSTAGLSANI